MQQIELEPNGPKKKNSGQYSNYNSKHLKTYK